MTAGMGAGVSLGRIAGIRVRADWSLFLIFGLIAVGLATEIFPGALPHQGAVMDWLLALIATVLFLASLLAHELAHAVAARRRGVTVEGITLWLFGGLAKLHGEVATPGDEARVSGVGPLVTVALAAASYGVAQGLSSAGAPAEVVVVPVWLAVMNGLLAAFNLLPALPLDGGRLLHSMLWKSGGDRGRATALAARGGVLFGVLLIAGGILDMMTLASIEGLWLLILGWFLVGSARAEAGQARMGTALAGLRVADVMTSEPVVAPGWLTVDGFIGGLDRTPRHSTFPVRDFEGRIIGLVSVASLAGVPREHRSAVRVAAVTIGMDQVVSTRPEEPLLELVQRMRGPAQGHALVFEDSRLVGVVSRSDILRAARLAELKAQPLPQ